MKPTNEVELTFAQKAKIVGTMSLVTVALMASAVRYTSYQRNAKIEAAKLAKTQLANAEKSKAELPFFRDTAYGKNYLAEQGEKNMVKIPFASLPTTFTPDNITSGLPASSPSVTAWAITKGGSTVATNSVPNGWSVGTDFSISIPSLTDGTHGTFDVSYIANDNDDPGNFASYTASFKITPPCPTSVTLTHN